MDARRQCTGVVLAGGLATRMGGTAKGMLLIDGVRIVDRVAAALSPVVNRSLLSICELDHDVLPGWPRVRDAASGRGPVAGIHAALELAGTDILVCAWDMPGAVSPLFRELRRLGEAGHDAVVPVGAGGHPEPLCAWYSSSTRDAFGGWLKRGEVGPVLSALSNCRVLLLGANEVRRFGDPATMLRSVNSAADLAPTRAREVSAP